MVMRRKGESPALPAWKAFVVQFSREAESQRSSFTGRVEYLSSGRQAHFESPQQLLDVLDQLLHELRDSGA